MKNLIKMGIKAKSASSETVSEKIKNKILLNFLKLIRTNKKKILIENKKDVHTLGPEYAFPECFTDHCNFPQKIVHLAKENSKYHV